MDLVDLYKRRVAVGDPFEEISRKTTEVLQRQYQYDPFRRTAGTMQEEYRRYEEWKRQQHEEWIKRQSAFWANLFQ